MVSFRLNMAARLARISLASSRDGVEVAISGNFLVRLPEPSFEDPAFDCTTSEALETLDRTRLFDSIPTFGTFRLIIFFLASSCFRTAEISAETGSLENGKFSFFFVLT